MAELVNLRQVRKRKQRAEKEKRAEENRNTHGRPFAEKAATRRVQDLERQRLEAHRRNKPGEHER
jgi:hypothetical protein